MTTDRKSKGGLLNRGTLLALIVIGMLVVALSAGALQKLFQPDDFLAGQPVFDVIPGPLRIDVSVAGTVKSRDQLIVKSELEGRATILYLIPEGTQVKKGDRLVELDATGMIDQRVDQEIKVKNAEAAYVMARENFEIVKSQAQSNIDQAQLVYDFAVLDLEKYIEGELPKEVKTLNENITLYEEEASRKEEVYKWSQILFSEKYLAETELKADELAAKQAKLRAELTKDDLDLLNEFTKRRMVAQLTSDVTQAEMALDRTKLQANAEIVQASAELEAKLSEYDREKSKLTKLEQQIAKAVIKAPTDGLVVYATSVRMDFRRNEEPLDEGQEVRERQELIYLPTTSAYIAEVRVHESSLQKVHAGLPARITVDALPGKVFSGRVSQIAPLADANSAFMNPDLKVYRTEIEINGGDGNGLRSGMNCRAEIIVDEYPEAIFVPMHAVVLYGGQPMVYVAKDNQWEKRHVKLGLDNNRMIRITDGLAAGDVVWLAPPLAPEKEEQTVAAAGGLEQPQPPTDQTRPMQSDSLDAGGPAERPRPQEMEGQDAAGGSFRSEEGRGQGRRDRAGRSPGQGGEMRGRFGNMSPEEREAMRQRFENMSPEEREAMRQRFQQERGGSPREGGPGPQ